MKTKQNKKWVFKIDFLKYETGIILITLIVGGEKI